MTDKIIELKNVTFRYDENQEKPTLNNISFHVKHGEWLSIIGHNGSGKSTTVRLIDGLLEAESGQILIEGHKLSEDNVWDIRHKISMVFQNPDNQFVGATVEDDIAFGLENKGIPLKEMRERVVEALNLVDMSDFKTREPARLSGGQKQRVAIAGAVAMRPSIIILDEATLSDRVLVMKNGQIESSSSPRELFSRGDELLDLGLDIPFTSTIIKALRQIGFTFDNHYLLEKELEDKLWALISKK